MVVFASDLDNTLIYSHKRMPDGVLVELYEGRPCSYMTLRAHAMLRQVAEKIMFVPVTTRSLDQYRRIDFGLAAPPPYALCSNGGILLRDGREDPLWREETQALINDALPTLEQGMALLAQRGEITLGPRLVDGIFVFAKSSDVEKTCHALQQALDPQYVFVDRVGEKAYIFPKVLDKGAALRRLRCRMGDCFVYSAGDSAFDIPLLLEADVAIIPDEEPLRGVLSGREGCCIAAGESRLHFGDEVLHHVLTACEKQENTTASHNN